MNLKDFTQSYRAILRDLTQQRKKMLITMHRWLDGDALGSALGLGRILKKLDIDSTVVCVPFIPDKFQFLGRKSHLHVVNPRTIGAEDIRGVYITVLQEYFEDLITDYGALTILDCAGFNQIPEEVWTIANHLPHIINIDHHMGYRLEEPKDRVLNLVKNQTSTCAILYHLMKALEVDLDPDIALPLYVGAIADLRKNDIDETSDRYPEAMIHELDAHIRKLDRTTQAEIEDIFALDPWEACLLDITMTGIRFLDSIAYVTFDQQTVYQAKEKTDSLHNPRMPFHEFHIQLRQKLNQYEKDCNIVVIFDQILDKVSLYNLQKDDSTVDMAGISRVLGDGGGHANRAGFSYHAARDRLIELNMIQPGDSQDATIEKMIEFISDTIRKNR